MGWLLFNLFYRRSGWPPQGACRGHKQSCSISSSWFLKWRFLSPTIAFPADLNHSLAPLWTEMQGLFFFRLRDITACQAPGCIPVERHLPTECRCSCPVDLCFPLSLLLQKAPTARNLSIVVSNNHMLEPQLSY